MKILGFIRCLFAAHEPNRKRIKKLEDGGYIGLCYHCGAKVKQRKRNHWVRDWRRRPALKKSTRANDSVDFEG